MVYDAFYDFCEGSEKYFESAELACLVFPPSRNRRRIGRHVNIFEQNHHVYHTRVNVGVLPGNFYDLLPAGERCGSGVATPPNLLGWRPVLLPLP